MYTSEISSFISTLQFEEEKINFTSVHRTYVHNKYIFAGFNCSHLTDYTYVAKDTKDK